MVVDFNCLIWLFKLISFILTYVINENQWGLEYDVKMKGQLDVHLHLGDNPSSRTYYCLAAAAINNNNTSRSMVQSLLLVL